MNCLVTGAAGFIGAAVAARLLADGHRVWGVDNFTPFYDVALKRHRWQGLAEHPDFTGIEADITDARALRAAVAAATPDRVFHFAAQAGVRHSLDAPRDYLAANVNGTFEVLEAANRAGVAHLVLASTSSAYGAREDAPFRETDPAARPVSLYAATKLAGEAIAHAQSHRYGLPVTALRFFTVYGERGRPDMAPHLFTESILRGAPIRVFNHGDMARDFTYIDDLVEAVVRVAATPPQRARPVSPRDSLSPVAPFRIVNIGQSRPVALLDFIHAIEAATGRKARPDMQPMQPGDVRLTHADPGLLHDLTGYVPTTSIREGIARYVRWFRDYHGV